MTSQSQYGIPVPQFRIALVGPPTSGKTSLLAVISKKGYPEEYIASTEIANTIITFKLAAYGLVSFLIYDFPGDTAEVDFTDMHGIIVMADRTLDDAILGTIAKYVTFPAPHK